MPHLLRLDRGPAVSHTVGHHVGHPGRVAISAPKREEPRRLGNDGPHQNSPDRARRRGDQGEHSPARPALSEQQHGERRDVDLPGAPEGRHECDAEAAAGRGAQLGRQSEEARQHGPNAQPPHEAAEAQRRRGGAEGGRRAGGGIDDQSGEEDRPPPRPVAEGPRHDAPDEHSGKDRARDGGAPPGEVPRRRAEHLLPESWAA
mmetsp:Transcript_48007/g.145035  ORF Transcript_48007/g.145035 Transcript_48007/m.145035 type:complete len:203 (-) Transcript_48007:309-917(-)